MIEDVACDGQESEAPTGGETPSTSSRAEPSTATGETPSADIEAVAAVARQTPGEAPGMLEHDA